MRLRMVCVGVMALTLAACGASQPLGPSSSSMGMGDLAAQNGAGGFDQYGYNLAARIFNGTGASWSVAKGLPADYLGVYAPDKLVMKWTAEWDRGNATNWSDPAGYRGAWNDNEWNGKCAGCSGSVWHYKTKWIGACGADYTPLDDGGYCIWGEFEVVMDQGQDPSYGPGHLWFAKATPNGYGH